jgi:hypothetical protein
MVLARCLILLLMVATGCMSVNDTDPGPSPAGSEGLGEVTQDLAGAPNCYYPVNCVSSPYQTFYWTGVPGAVEYRSNFWKYVKGQEVFLGGYSTSGTSISPFTLEPYTLYRWKVKGEGPGGNDPGPYCGGGIGKYVYYSPQGCY